MSSIDAFALQGRPDPSGSGYEETPVAPPRVLAVVVTHNGEEWLATCLKSLSRQIYSNLDVIVVDSGSRVELDPALGGLLPTAELIRVESNVGFGAAANVALEVSSKAPAADYFLFLHDDVELEPESISLMIATAVESGAGIVGAKGVEWDHPERLVEVGMSADQFGYPYSDLEPGEIDQGQHDAQRETLFVTSACILVSRSFIERCGLWDGGYFAFGEDLDLCTRARISGFKVMVQPGARFRHIVALANGRRVVRRMPSIRFLTRRNRLRTIAKNVAFIRMLAIIAMYLPLTAAEIAMLIFFRRFDEIVEYPRAFGSFVLSLPDIIRRRRAIQKRRTVSDRRIKRFMVSDVNRARVFFENRLRAWERGTLALGTRTLSHLAPSAIKASVQTWVRRPVTIATAATALLLLFALRSVLVGDPVAAGTLLPFPDEAGRFLREYFAGWRDVSLGSESAAPASFPILWLFGAASLGEPVVAQKLLLVVLVGIGLFGIHRLVNRRTALTGARIVAVALYALSPVVHLAVSTGDSSALALYAGLPFMLEIALRMLGTGPSVESYSTETAAGDVARLGLISAAVVALAPSALIAIGFLWLILSAAAAVMAFNTSTALARATGLLSSIPAAVFLLIPWTLEALRPDGAILAPLFAGTRGPFHKLWSDHNFEEMLLLNAFGRLGGLTTFAVALGALVLAGTHRRKETRLLITAWLCFASIGGLAAKGIIASPVASAAMWMMVPLVILAALSGHLVAGMREELPRHSFGWRHKIATPALAALFILGVLASWLPQLPGWDRPEPAFASGVGEGPASISSFLQSTAEQTGDFRVLWLGKRWVDPVRAGGVHVKGPAYFLTGSAGLNMLNMEQPPDSLGEERLGRVIGGLYQSRLHLAGHLLAPASVRFIIVDPRDEDSMSALRSQRDIALEQQQDEIAIFRNLQWLPRAVLAPANLVGPVKSGNDRNLMIVKWSGGRRLPSVSPTSYRGELPRTRHSQILLAENYNKSWHARVGNSKLKQAKAFGWANRFELPPDAKGQIRIRFAGRPIRILWLALQALVILVFLAMARSSKPGQIPGRLK